MQETGTKEKNKKNLLPEAEKEPCKMQGHWLLAKMGKRVLRPGGVQLTRDMLADIGIGPEDHVVEFAPGLGITAAMTLKLHPATYTAIEKDKTAAQRIQSMLNGTNQQCRQGTAEDTGLDAESATVVYGEAMLTMHPDGSKRKIMHEAARILKPGGRYGIHEVCFTPGTSPELQQEIKQAMSRAIHVGASPATQEDWQAMLEAEGFSLRTVKRAPFKLLEPARMIADEGLLRTLRFWTNILLHPTERKIIKSMRNIFHQYRSHINGMIMIVEKR